MSRTRALLRALGGLVLGLLLLLGMPVALVTVVGWPLPREIPDGPTVSRWLDEPLNTDVLIDLAAIVLWLLWALLVAAVAAEVLVLVRRARVPAVRLGGPLQGVAAGLVGAVGIAVAGTAAHATPAVPVAAASARPSDPAEPPGEASAVVPAPALPNGPGLVVVDGCAHPYTVRPGDSLWHIAEDCLGDGNRWPEIWSLNQGRFWPHVSGSIRLDDPDLIYPQWTLELPSDATPPIAPTEPAQDGPAAGGTPDKPTPRASVAVTASAMAVTPSAVPTSSVVSGPEVTPYANDPSNTDPASPTDGIDLPGGSWIPWSLGGALVSAAAMVWLQRRRRYVPRPIEDSIADDPTPVPPVLRRVQAARRTNQPLAVPASVAQPPTEPQPDVELPMATYLAGGVGLAGPGGPSAARGALVAALSSGGPIDPHARTHVVVPADVLAGLLDADPRGFGSWARLQITATLDEALTVLEERLLYTARQRDRQHDSTTASEPEPVVPLLLITAPPPASSRARLRAILRLGHAAASVSAVVLGEWETATVHVDTDGTNHKGDGAEAAAVPARLAVLDPAQTIDLLYVLREADTGQPRPSSASPMTVPDHPFEATPPIEADADTAEPVPVAADASTEDTAAVPAPRGPSARARAQVRVLGRPDVLGRPSHIPMRGYASEIMVYLAVYADGAPSEQILDSLWPTERRHITANRLYTGVSNLRRILAASAGDESAVYVDKRHGRYRLNPDTVEVDLWQLRSGHSTARAMAGQDPLARVTALQLACLAATGPLAAGESYDWIEPHRHGTLKLTLDAHAALATAVQDDQPGEAARLLDVAFNLDPLNEHLCRAAITAHHRAGSTDAIHGLLRTLTRALAGIGEKPTMETTALAAQLSNVGKRPPSPQTMLPAR